MSHSEIGLSESTRPASRARIVELLERFLADWKRGGDPRLEDYLAGLDEPAREEAFRALLELDLTLHRNAAREPAQSAYEARFPRYRAAIQAVFRSAATTAPLLDFELTTEFAPGGPRRRPSASAASGEAAEVRFHLLEELGRGGMGVVHRARKMVWRDGQLVVDRMVAVKKLYPAYAADATAICRFWNEAAIASRQTNARILHVEDVVDIDGGPALVMPLIAGGNLDRRIEAIWSRYEGENEDGVGAATFPTEAVLALLDEVVEALAALHEARVLHRDIKPSNILIDHDDHVRLADFGLARLAHETELTPGGFSIGTPGYMSPEQWSGRPDLDSGCDVFGLGATLYKALTGELPYGKHRLTEAEPPPNPPGAFVDGISPALDAVILKAIHPDRDQRYRSGVELRADWQRARADAAWQPLLENAKLAAAGHRPGRGGRRGAWLALGVVALCVLAWAALQLVALWKPRAPMVPVIVATTPPADRAAFVPIDAESGQPRRDRAVQVQADANAAVRAPIEVALPPGEYIVEVAAGDRFQEVRRRVPDAEELRAGRGFVTQYRSLTWRPGANGAVEWPNIQIPEADAAEGMARFEGSPNFLMGSRNGPAGAAGGFPHEVVVAPFDLDTTEVTVDRFRAVVPESASDCGLDLPDVAAISCVNFYDALQYAEAVGKRLPDEAEYEFAATVGGTRTYPWGDRLGPIAAGVWPFGPAGEPTLDNTATEPPVYGLYSNVAEWTATLFRPYPGESWDFLPTDTYNTARAVRGGPASIVNRRELLEDPAPMGPRERGGYSPQNIYPGLGFRCARSAAPRFLDR